MRRHSFSLRSTRALTIKGRHCHNPAPDTPDWPPTHLWDPTYLPTCTLDSGHSDFPTTPGTLVSCPTDPTCLLTCLSCHIRGQHMVRQSHEDVHMVHQAF